MTGSLKSWIETANAPDCEFPIQNLPYGVFSVGGQAPRCGVAIGDRIVDLAACEDAGFLDAGGTFAAPHLNDFIALGRTKWTEIRAVLTAPEVTVGSALLAWTLWRLIGNGWRGTRIGRGWWWATCAIRRTSARR